MSIDSVNALLIFNYPYQNFYRACITGMPQDAFPESDAEHLLQHFVDNALPLDFVPDAPLPVDFHAGDAGADAVGAGAVGARAAGAGTFFFKKRCGRRTFFLNDALSLDFEPDAPLPVDFLTGNAGAGAAPFFKKIGTSRS